MKATPTDHHYLQRMTIEKLYFSKQVDYVCDVNSDYQGQTNSSYYSRCIVNSDYQGQIVHTILDVLWTVIIKVK